MLDFRHLSRSRGCRLLMPSKLQLDYFWWEKFDDVFVFTVGESGAKVAGENLKYIE